MLCLYETNAADITSSSSYYYYYSTAAVAAAAADTTNLCGFWSSALVHTKLSV
jgi:hypothetical protein